ncbi:MAG TPA: hypothetical protein VFV58_24945 [Blastocatellia bacterium]|nr:hypothetical protein [Blastocatellia bacterium]
MAGSRTPGPTRHDPFSKRVTARTPGPLGRNDAADPNALALLGDTSSSLGVKDHAEPFAYKAGQDFPLPVSRQQVESIKKEAEIARSRYGNPDGKAPVFAWDLLTKQEREIIAKKIKLKKDETVAQAFNGMVDVRGKSANEDQAATEAQATHVINFIDRAGGRRNSPMWQQISGLLGITGPHLVITIPDYRKFLIAAEKEGFQAIRGSDQFLACVGIGYHKFNSVREVTPFSTDFSMHFANDNGNNTYYVHWDPTSVTFIPQTGWSMYSTDPAAKSILYNTEWLYRAFFHGSFPRPAEVREQLKRYGQAPRER